MRKAIVPRVGSIAFAVRGKATHRKREMKETIILVRLYWLRESNGCVVRR